MSAAVFNHVVDEKIDTKMSRTDRRPLPEGRVTRNQALIWGFFLGIVGISLLVIYVNLLAPESRAAESEFGVKHAP